MSNILAPFQLLELNVISAQDLAPVTRNMRTYAVSWVHPEKKLSTRVDTQGHTNPTWNDKFVFRVDEEFLYADTSAIMIDIYALHWFKDVHVGTVRVLVGNLIPPPSRPFFNNRAPLGMRFVALQVRRASGRPQGILNIGVAVLDSSMRSMPLYTLNSSAVGYRHLMGEKDAYDSHNHLSPHRFGDNNNNNRTPTAASGAALAAAAKPVITNSRPELRRTKSDTSSMMGNRGRANSAISGSVVSGSSLASGGGSNKKKGERRSKGNSSNDNNSASVLSSDSVGKRSGKGSTSILSGSLPWKLKKKKTRRESSEAQSVSYVVMNNVQIEPPPFDDNSNVIVEHNHSNVIEEIHYDSNNNINDDNSGGGGGGDGASSVNTVSEAEINDTTNTDHGNGHGQLVPAVAASPKPQFRRSPAPKFRNSPAPPKLLSSPAVAQFKNSPKPQFANSPKPQQQFINSPKLQFQNSPKPQYRASPAVSKFNPPVGFGGSNRATPLHNYGYTPRINGVPFEYTTPRRSNLGNMGPPVVTESELGPSASEVAAAMAKKPVVDEGENSTVGGWSLDESVEGLQSKLERWRTELPPVIDRGEFSSFPTTSTKTGSRHTRRNTDSGLFSCFSNICGVECSIVCGGDPKGKKKSRRRTPSADEATSFL